MTAFTEFYCNTGGSNLNAGSTTGTTAVYTGVGDSDGTSVFTPSDGSTPANTVSVGDFGSVYVTAGATVAVFVGRVTNVAAGVNGAITFSTTAKSGTFPAASGGAHTITCKTGGAWKGPNGTSGFPFNFITNALTNASGNVPRVNFITGTNYAITAAITHANAGPIRFQGYTSSPGDGGRFVIDGGTAGASYALLTISGANNDLADAILQNNGATGSATGLAVTGGECSINRVVVNSVRGVGISLATNLSSICNECEVYSANQSNTASLAGFSCSIASCQFNRCIAHDNSGSNTSGFRASAHAFFTNCIADTNGATGFELAVTTACTLLQCDAYANVSHGINLNNASAAVFYIENCNLVDNGTGGTGYGINGAGAGARNGSIRNCAFGSGTAANTSGTTNALSGINEVGSITYAANVTPWVDPANGDFRINLAAAINAGRGTFTQTAASYAGAIGYPDVGAAQHLEAAASGGGGHIIGSF